MCPKAAHENAGIQYLGQPGATKPCCDAIVGQIQLGVRIERARVLSCKRSHAFLLTVDVGDLVAIKSGFGSGYLGEGSVGFSYVLQLLDAHGVEIEEYEVDKALLRRLDLSALTWMDLNSLDAAVPVRPTRWHEYVMERHLEQIQKQTLWREFPMSLPLAAIDPRVMDLAISFADDPDRNLLSAYRRLEDLVRARTGLSEHGVKLFSQAFNSSSAKLRWPGVDAAEQGGRASLFVGAFAAFRNPRAHRETRAGAGGELLEFLLINHLFCLEREAEVVTSREAAVQPS